MAVAITVGVLGVLAVACGSDGEGVPGAGAGRERTIRAFFEAGGAGDCPIIEDLSTAEFQQRLGCDWMTAMRGDTQVTALAPRDAGDPDSGEVNYLVTLDTFAFNGDMNVELVSDGDVWLVNDVHAVMDAG